MRIALPGTALQWEKSIDAARARARVLQPLNPGKDEELFLKLVHEKAGDEEVRIVDRTGVPGAPTPSCRRRP